jgi:hypothetical protein
MINPFRRKIEIRVFIEDRKGIKEIKRVVGRRTHPMHIYTIAIDPWKTIRVEVKK